VGNTLGAGPESNGEEIPARNCVTGHAERRLCKNPLRLHLTAIASSSRTFSAGSLSIRISPSHRLRWCWPSLRLSAGFLIPSRDPSQPHKVGETNNCARQRRKLRHCCASAPRPNLALIDRAVS
jgi:hypothetical protein